MDKTYKLLIIFTNGVEQVIPDVTEYGSVGLENATLLHYIRNNCRSIVPVHAVRYFGEYSNYYSNRA